MFVVFHFRKYHHPIYFPEHWKSKSNCDICLVWFWNYLPVWKEHILQRIKNKLTTKTSEPKVAETETLDIT